MVHIIPKLDVPASIAAAPRIVYLGLHANEMCDLVSPHIGAMAIDYSEKVVDTLALIRSAPFDVIIIDERDAPPSQQLILPLLRSIQTKFKLIIISAPEDVSNYLRMPGVARVLSEPLRAKQLSKALGLDVSKLRHDKVKLSEEAKKENEAPKPQPKLGPLVWLSNLGMQLVSTAYKRLAFVLLGVLFLSFAFYGTMIGFFLTSSSWSAPQVLVRGHVLVDRVEKEISDAKLTLNLNKQRLAETIQQASEAENAASSAQILVNFAGDTVSKEIISRKRQVKVIEQNIARTEKIRKAFAKQLKTGGLSAELSALYGKHLIDRKTFTSNTLGLLDSGQRMAGMEAELDLLASDKAQLVMQLSMLNSLKAQLQQQGPLENITAASSDLLLLTKQSLDARQALDTARNNLIVTKQTHQTLLNSQKVIEQQIATLENSTLGRAITSRVNVMFVPYGNDEHFKTGADLYSCRFTFVVCSKVGTVGQILPGEIASVHPFFGKPIRGFYVEANLTDPTAATREIIHANHAPLYF
jgi:hypothetical protein